MKRGRREVSLKNGAISERLGLGGAMKPRLRATEFGWPLTDEERSLKKKKGKCNETVVRAMVLKLYEPPNPLGGLLAH